ncbi:MAG TPA: UxaA family hydrolase [Spirochaetia bacterium]|nr:UxaA family hydrolase [Spirochaetia bacterium]
MKHGALMHEPEDDVAVVVADTPAGTEIQAVTLDGKEVTTVKASQDIPLGHKIAVRDVAVGKDVIKYGRPIGRASAEIRKGSHVHTHNLKSKRWA